MIFRAQAGLTRVPRTNAACIAVIACATRCTHSAVGALLRSALSQQAKVFFLFTRDRELQVEFYISQPFCPHQLKVKTDFHVAIDKVTTLTCGNFRILPVLFGLLTFAHHIALL